jgi:uncharacterized protein
MTKNTSLLLQLFILIGCVIVPNTHADFTMGANHYAQGHYDKAFNEFMAAAEYGDHDSQQNIGAMYYRGEHVAKDIPTAYAWMALAAQSPSIKQKGIHSKILSKLDENDKKIALKRYLELEKKYGDEAIKFKLTPTFIGKSAGLQDRRAIKRVIPEYPLDMVRVGKTGFVDIVFTIDKYGYTRDHIVYYSPSKSFEKKAVEALRKFQYEPSKINNKPIDINGYKIRHNFLFSERKVDDAELTNIVDEMREKAQSGKAIDQLAFAYFLEAVPSFAKDYKFVDNPNEWYINAANNGNGAASYFLGRNILYGNMCEQDPIQSMAWLLKAAKQGITDAQYMLALEAFSGAHFEKNEEKAFYWLKQAATSNAPAKVRLAWILATHPDAARRSGSLASAYIDAVTDDYIDKQNYFQTKAAVAAENGDFKTAIKWQKKAKKDAKNLELPLGIVEQQLASYLAQKPWREEI